MADRLTQLQDTINQQAENLCNAIGILQQHAPPSLFPGFDRSGNKTPQQQPASHEDYEATFAKLIARVAKDIDALIDSLPTEDSTGELQAACLRNLETENQDAAQKLEAAVKRGEALLQQVQSALSDIATSQLKHTI